MATSSFDKSFIVHNSASIQKMHQSLATTHPIQIEKKDIKEESQRGALLLKRFLSR